ncbi:hypothetical protein CLCR_07758 [Cladophialophora carrionii]|uniref:Uncharacterized protein n=1 Tax=Cladophialophora carrionii TaxID=86049 RepID=A0A1C1CNR3_9EURO|nr:hypothetical protein CLCR_07758 [Cladophialophora carrionii]
MVATTLALSDNYAHKRVASSQLSQRRPSKRVRAGLIQRPHMSSLDSLPTEILEQIFLASLNGNLLLAAPRVAVRLSGSEALYRATFALAFFNHALESVLNHLGISLLVPIPEILWTIGDIRSSTKLY